MLNKPTTFALMATIATAALAQQAPPPADKQQPTPPDSIRRPTEETRHYRHQRDRSLSEHERFDYSNIPPGYDVETWSREMAATQAYDRGYEDGYEEGFRAAQRDATQAQTESLYDAAVDQGVERFKSRNYGAALRNFILAARSDQGDPASRLHAAHAMTALGHYDDAYLLTRRAFQLQPQLIYIPLDIRQFYASKTEFDTQLNHLRTDAAAADTNPKLWALLGYFQFFSDQHAEAYRSIKRASELAPGDRFIATLLDAARLRGQCHS